MKKVLLLAAAVVAAAPAFAEWTPFEATDDGKWYIDIKTLRVMKDKKRVWVLLDHKKPNTDHELSTLFLYEVDCAESRFRMLQYAGYKKQMGGGSVATSSEATSAWSYSGPGTVADVMMKGVCS